MRSGGQSNHAAGVRHTVQDHLLLSLHCYVVCTITNLETYRQEYHADALKRVDITVDEYLCWRKIPRAHCLLVRRCCGANTSSATVQVTLGLA